MSQVRNSPGTAIPSAYVHYVDNNIIIILASLHQGLSDDSSDYLKR